MILKDKENAACAWIVYCFPEVIEGEIGAMLDNMQPKWMKHPILKKKK
jgi:hypothetical protein